MSNNGNGFTQKEMLTLILDGQADINDRIDQLHEKVNQKISKLASPFVWIRFRY